MLQNSLIVFNQILIMFLLMGVGFFLYNRSILDDHTTKKLSVILSTYIMPCCVIEAFQRPFDRVLAKSLAWTFFAAVLLFVISIAVCILIFPKMHLTAVFVQCLATTVSWRSPCWIPYSEAPAFFLAPRILF